MAKALGNHTAEYRWFAAVYLFLCFLVLPLTVFGLSLAGWQILVGVGVPIVFLVIVIIVINVMQSRCPRCLPSGLRNWDFLPLPLHSMEPWDRIVTSVTGFCGTRCCCCCKCCRRTEEEKDGKDRRKSLEMYDNPVLSRDGEPDDEVVRATHL